MTDKPAKTSGPAATPDDKPAPAPAPAPKSGPAPAKKSKPKPRARTGRKRSPVTARASRETSRSGWLGGGFFRWFLGGLALAFAIVAALLVWNAWSNPHIVVAPRLDDLITHYAGYLAALALILAGLAAALMLRGRAARIAPAVLVISGGLMVALYTVLLVLGAGTMCGRKALLSEFSPDRRVLVIASRGKCGLKSQPIYRVSVRELGPSLARQALIFESHGKPVPVEIRFLRAGTVTVVAKEGETADPKSYTITLDRAEFSPSRIWRFKPSE